MAALTTAALHTIVECDSDEGSSSEKTPKSLGRPTTRPTGRSLSAFLDETPDQLASLLRGWSLKKKQQEQSSSTCSLEEEAPVTRARSAESSSCCHDDCSTEANSALSKTDSEAEHVLHPLDYASTEVHLNGQAIFETWSEEEKALQQSDTLCSMDTIHSRHLNEATFNSTAVHLNGEEVFNVWGQEEVRPLYVDNDKFSLPERRLYAVPKN